jgi:hypothetical protein
LSFDDYLFKYLYKPFNMLEEKLKKDLDGKYIVYEFGEMRPGSDEEGWELTLFKVEWPNSIDVSGKSEYGEVGWDENEHFFKQLKKKKITEVIALHNTGPFLGIPQGCFSDSDDPEDWHEYKQIWPETDAYQYLIENDISVKFYDVESAEFIPS